MDMKIYKSYNHKILSENEKIIDFSKVNKQNLRNFYDRHNTNTSFVINNKRNNYTEKKHSRKLNGCISYSQLSSKYNTEYEFAINYDKSNKISSTSIKKHYPKEWQDCLIYYDLHFISYLFIQFLEYECDQLIKLTNGKHKINIIYSSKITTDKNVDDVIFHVLNIVEWLIDTYKKDHKLILNILLAPMEKSFNNTLNDTLYNMYDWSKWTQDIPNNGINPMNINTGVSWKTNKENYVTLFRSDELFKVLIHELIHNLDLDIKCNLCEHIVQKDIHFHVGNTNSYPILYNEAYVEYNALLLWNYYLVKHYNNNEIDHFVLFNHMIDREIINGAINCKKIFDYYGISDLKIFSSHNNINQYTNAFSYIFIKYLLLINCYDFNIDTQKNQITKSTDLNYKLKQIMENINDYNYLFNIQTNCKKLRLSIYNFKGI